ncbi:probable G-protein coupled receptor 101 [Sorex araneus]|uniref:probable G-protein coupled receptor 101 n=1 Tax=Sorex araneus TaxID=42254 RepID=UPI0024338E6A|nr:probable G-protein coupled receptor 101 [Sorex araneus]
MEAAWNYTANITEALVNITNTVCMPLTKMPITLAHGIIRSVVLIIFMIVSLVGNLVLVVVLQRKPQISQTTNQFIFNLLVTDLLQSALVGPWVITTSLPYFWPINIHFCTALVSLAHLFAFASVNSIIVVSIDRYMTIMYPLTYPNMLTNRRGQKLLYGTWIVGLFQSTPPLCGLGQAAFDDRNAICFLFWEASPSYTFVSVMFFFVIPLAVMIFCYTGVYGVARRQHALMHVRVRRLDVGTKVEEEEKKEDEFHDENEVEHQDAGEVEADEIIEAAGGASMGDKNENIVAEKAEEAEEVEEVEEAEEAEEVEDSNANIEGTEDGVESESFSTTAHKGSSEEDHCNMYLGEDDTECGDDEVISIEAVKTPENIQCVQDSNEPPVPKSCHCKALKVIFMIIFSYVLCVGPYCFLAVLAVWVDVQTKVPQWVITIIIWLFFLQCCIHPYIYGYMHKPIRKEIHNLLREYFPEKSHAFKGNHPNLPAKGGRTTGKVDPSEENTTAI